MSKTISFSTLTGREFLNIPFDVEGFFEHFFHCGTQGISATNQIILLLNNLFESELAVNPYDSVFKIIYEQTEDFLERYQMVDNVLKYHV